MMDVTVSLQNTLVPRPDVLFRYVEGEAVLLNSETGQYFGLDPVGTRVWQLIVEHQALTLVFDAMLAEFAVAPSELEADLLALAHQLHAQGLVVLQPPS